MPDLMDAIGDAEARRLDDLQRHARVQADNLAKQTGARMCVDCGDDIPARRRELLPHVLTCIECESERDWLKRRQR